MPIVHQEDDHGPYILERGEVWFVDRSASPWSKALNLHQRHVCGPGDLMAVAYDTENGILHKHGPAPLVSAWANKTRHGFLEMGADDMSEALVVISFPPHPEALAEVNACISVSGRILEFQKRLGHLTDDYGFPRGI
jgi:hypothetical protein